MHVYIYICIYTVYKLLYIYIYIYMYICICGSQAQLGQWANGPGVIYVYLYMHIWKSPGLSFSLSNSKYVGPGPNWPNGPACIPVPKPGWRGLLYDGCSGFHWNIDMLLHKWSPQAIYPSRHHIQLHVSFWTSRNMSLDKSGKCTFRSRCQNGVLWGLK